MLSRYSGFVLLLLAFSPSLHAEFCALHIFVSSPGGSAFGPIEVSLFKGNELVQTGVTKGGVVSFCDFDLGKHDVVVRGEKGCYDTVVKGIQLTARIEQKISITQNICFFNSVHISPPACHALVKISDWNKHSAYPLKLEVIREDGSPVPLPLDSMGRSQDVVREQKTSRYNLSHLGKVISSEVVRCENQKDIIKVLEVMLP